MANNLIYTTFVVNTGNGIDDPDLNSRVIVARSGSVLALNGTGLNMTGSIANVVVDGAVSGYNGIHTGLIDGATNGFSVRIGVTGTVSATYYGISVSGNSGSVSNAGYIGGAYGIIGGFFDSNGPDLIDIVNSGTIAASEAGIVMLADTVSISNSGTIQSTDSTRFSSAGSLGILVGGILVLGTGTVVSNSGSILTASTTGYGIAVAGTGTLVINSGLIQTNSTDPARAAVDLITIAGETGQIVNAAGGLIVAPLTAIETGAGNEILRNAGQVQGDVIMGDGNDTVLNSGTIFGTVDLGIGDDRYIGQMAGFVGGPVIGGAGNDKLFGGSLDDEFYGGADTDTLRGGGGNDALYGGAANDVMRGDAGDDTLFGGTGIDRLLGGSGEDVLQGDGERDILTGGTGADEFIYIAVADSLNGPGSDIITDFESGIDVINLDAINAGDLAFVGTGAFTGGGTGSVRYQVTAAGHATVLIDSDGDGTADMRITVQNHTVIEAGDFIL